MTSTLRLAEEKIKTNKKNGTKCEDYTIKIDFFLE